LDGNDETELARLMRARLKEMNEPILDSCAGRLASCAALPDARSCRGGIDPEDIVQETLLAIHVKRHTWQDDAPVTPWL
jgi:RNA polymerase sigma-70 factor (ECF subfamily)